MPPCQLRRRQPHGAEEGLSVPRVDVPSPLAHPQVHAVPRRHGHGREGEAALLRDEVDVREGS